MSLVFACIAPHGDVDFAPELRAAMEELGRRCKAAAPDVAVVVSPHSVHVEGHFAVVTAGKVGEWETDGALAARLLEVPLPILGVSYGGNDPASAEFPLDWGTEVPLAFINAPRVVVVAPARDRSWVDRPPGWCSVVASGSASVAGSVVAVAECSRRRPVSTLASP